MKKDDLRPLVLEILRRDSQTHLNVVISQVKNLVEDYQRHDALKICEIIWELLVQGVLAPGKNSWNLNLPFVHATEYGLRCLEEDAVLLHDPNGYLERLEERVGQSLDDIVLTHVRESLLTVLAGRYQAAAVMLGVASERCIDLLAQAYTNTMADKSRRETFERKLKQAGRNIKQRLDILQDELFALALPTELGNDLDIQLSGVFALLRCSRDDAGHPTGQTIDRDTCHAHLLVFPQYCKRIYALIDYFQSTLCARKTQE